MHIHVKSLHGKKFANRKKVKILRKYSRQQISRALKYSKASLGIEGLFLTAQEERLLLERANGNMKYSEFLARAKEIAKNV